MNNLFLDCQKLTKWGSTFASRNKKILTYAISQRVFITYLLFQKNSQRFLIGASGDAPIIFLAYTLMGLLHEMIQCCEIFAFGINIIFVAVKR